MAGPRFAAAKSAALSFVAQAPADVKIGLVTFADRADTVRAPTTDRDALRAALGGLHLSLQTHLYDGVRAALATAGSHGQRRLLVLTDGHDTTGSPLVNLTDAVQRSGDKVDVVGLSVSLAYADALSKIATAGGGTLVNAADPNALGALFSNEAQALAGQIVVSFPVPRAKAGSDATLVLSIDAGGTTYADNAFVNLGTIPQRGHTSAPTTPIPVDPTTSTNATPLMVGGIGAIGIALLLVAATLLGAFHRETKATPATLLAGYGGLGQPRTPTAAPVNVRESAVDLTAKAIGSGGFEAKLSWKLDAAGVSLKPAEWVLLHAGLAIGAAFVGFLLSSGGVLMTLLLFLAGAVLPWLYLGFSASRRIRAFNGQLPDALQLIAGGLKAGLSLAQSLDSIVREGNEPMAGEFRRALMEARLGVGIEDALDGVATRMGSKDFEWVVMAVRIQREVGGNLAELLVTVSATLREREYLRRQVRALSAEGRLSAYILCAMPPIFLVYLKLTNPAGLRPMFHTSIGVALLAIAVMLMAVGSLWMSKIVKVEA